MSKISNFEYDCRISHVHTVLASFKSAKPNERAGELCRLHSAVGLLIGAEPKRMTETMASRKATAVLAAYQTIHAAAAA